MFVVVCLRNALLQEPARAAFCLAALGILLNILVVTANGGYMPQSPEARLTARGIPLVAEGAPARLLNVAPMTPSSCLTVLADIIAQPRWLPTANVISIGDVLLSVALAWWGFQMLASARPARIRETNTSSSDGLITRTLVTVKPR